MLNLILLLNSQHTMLLASLSFVFIVGSNAGLTMFQRRVQTYWLPTLFASFPFTSPPMGHVPSGFSWALLSSISKASFSRSSFCFMTTQGRKLAGIGICGTRSTHMPGDQISYHIMIFDDVHYG